MNINKTLIASGLCAMLLATGCTAAPVTRSLGATDARTNTTVTRSLDGYRTHNRYNTRNLLGRPLRRGHNANYRLHESNLRVGDNLTPNYPHPASINTPKRSQLPLVEVERTHEHKEHENKSEKAPGSKAKVRATEATEKLNKSSAEARKKAEHGIAKTKEANETKAKETKHTPKTVKTTNHIVQRSHETIRSPQHSTNYVPRTSVSRVSPRSAHTNIERGIIRTRNTANEVLVDRNGVDLDVGHYHPRHNSYHRMTTNRSHLRGYGFGNGYLRRNTNSAHYNSRGYVGNYNNGFDGFIRDYRFENALGRGHSYTRISHAYPMSYGYTHGRGLTNTLNRGTEKWRSNYF